ncbi:hypothetical protein Tcan_13226 [Toxocara canis]|uniref:Transmembrane protein n=1 Tax=Toxocara canis TaxID=6265 RepID=A0A0B2W2Z1_TOXCA|nr:hypothetical protein Tcan_13226 [Toxocara canis]
MLVRWLFHRVADCVRARKDAANNFLYFTAVFDSSCLLTSVTLLLSSPRPLLYSASISTSSSATIIAYALLFIRTELNWPSYRDQMNESCFADENFLTLMLYLAIAKLLLTLFSVAAFMWTNWMIPLEGLERFKRFVTCLQWSAILMSLFPLLLYSNIRSRYGGIEYRWTQQISRLST